MLQIQWTLGKHFLHPVGHGSIFPEKSRQDARRSGTKLARGQVNMADEAKLCSPICSTSEALVTQCVAGHFCGEELGHYCWPVLAAGLAVCSAPHWFAEHTSQMQWFNQDSKAVVDQTLNSEHNFYSGASLALESALELFLSPITKLAVAICCRKSTFPCKSLADWEMFPCYCIG